LTAPNEAATVRSATHGLMRALGMTTVFGNPGSTELRFFKDWPADFRYVLGLQESSVVAMADGYAQATRNAAFVNLHSAVGVGHAMGSVFTATRNQAPLVITAGQQTRAMLPTDPYLYAQQATELPQPYVKWGCEPARAEDVPAAVARAYYVAMQHPRGPTFVSVPEDDWDAASEPISARRVLADFGADPGALGIVAEALNRSRRPALVVGPGVDRDGAWALAVELAERTQAAVWVSPLSSRGSFPEDHPAFAGFLTPDRRKVAQRLSGHDVVVVLGAPVFTYHVHSEGPFLPAGTELFQLVDDPQAAALAPGTAVLATLRVGLAQLMERVDRVAPASREPLPGRARPPAPSAPPPTGPMSAEFVMHTVGRLMPQDAIVVEEAPTHRNAMHDHLPIRTSGGFFVGASRGLGYGLPAAVGVALGSPGRRVICLLGDGSSLYSIQALWTAAQHRLPISFIVLNNGAYVALKAFGRVMGLDRPPGVDLPGIGLPEIAVGFGCPASRVDRAEQFETALQSSFVAGGPTLLDVCVDPAIESLY
jgi:benzoylformate decarboxylase